MSEVVNEQDTHLFNNLITSVSCNKVGKRVSGFVEPCYKAK